MKPKILFVDDDSSLLAAFQRNYRNRFSFDIALGGEEALRLLQSTGPYAVVLADMNMPGLSGIEVLERVRELSPGSVRMMLTGNADQQTAINAVNRGAVFRFLNKPCPPDILGSALEAALQEHQMRQLERELLEGTVSGSIKMLTEVLGMVAPDALGRGQRLRDSITRFARWLKVEPLWELEIAALLSPIGYAAVPPAILHKLAGDSDLTLGEAAIVRRVPQIGHNLLVDIPRLKTVATILLYQDQHFDGTGFPADGCQGAALPLGSRLIKILNDRLTLEADGVVKQAAFNAMRLRKGLYDPQLLEQSFACLSTFLVNAISAERKVLPLPLNKLQPGDIIVSDIRLSGGALLVGAGSRLTAMGIERIANFARLGEVQEPFFIQREET
ncbi:MAG: response regulator [Opitutae bacterium]|nr:response regulator [Opitutae bacterium]